MSILRTAALLGLLTGMMLAIGFLWAGIAGMTLFFLLALGINFASYWFSDRIVLGMYQAKPIQKSQEPQLHRIVKKLAEEYKIPKPKIYMVNMPVLNAFATGRSKSHASVAVTARLLKNLSWGEIEGVLAHEMGHIANRDTLTSTLAATVAGAITYIAQMAWWGMFSGNNRNNGAAILFPLIIFTPIAAMLVQLAISRTREYAADKTGALVSKKPLELASALEKISRVAEQHPLKGNAATSHLFIVNPFTAGTLMSLFSTHPPVTERIRRLQELAALHIKS